MARPRTPIGTYGEIEFTTMPSGSERARVRFRDHDGKIRRVEATAASRAIAGRKLKQKLAERLERSQGSGDLTPDSSFAELVEVWLEDLDLDGRLARSTRSLYERDMRTLVMPTFEHYALREITVRTVDQFIKRMAANESHSRAKHARVVLSLALGLAVRYDAMSRNPVRETGRLRPPPVQPKALTAFQVEAIRAAVKDWRQEPGLSGPPPDGQLQHIIEVMLGTSARIGEVLALRKCDVDVTRSPATVRICGTIVSLAGQPTVRQPAPKTSKSTRMVAVPSFTAASLRARLVQVSDEDPEHLLFFSRNGTPLTTNNVRRQLRTILEGAGITGVTPHSFRRTVATVIDRAAGADLASEMLGHTSVDITRQHYIQPDEKVNPMTAQILESLAPKQASGDS